LRRAHSARDAEAGSDLVLLELGRGRYFTLNHSGAWIWQRLGAGTTLGELRDAFAAAFDIPLERAWDDLLVLIADLEAEGLVEIEGETSTSS